MDLEDRRARAYQKALDRRRLIPEGFLGFMDALRLSRLGYLEFRAVVSAGRIRWERFDGSVRAYRREDVETLTPDRLPGE